VWTLLGQVQQAVKRTVLVIACPHAGTAESWRNLAGGSLVAYTAARLAPAAPRPGRRSWALIDHTF
jgi:hypothetical protein